MVFFKIPYSRPLCNQITKISWNYINLWLLLSFEKKYSLNLLSKLEILAFSTQKSTHVKKFPLDCSKIRVTQWKKNPNQKTVIDFIVKFQKFQIFVKDFGEWFLLQTPVTNYSILFWNTLKILITLKKDATFVVMNEDHVYKSTSE